MASDDIFLMPYDQKKGLVRSKEDEVLLEKIDRFRKAHQTELKNCHDDIQKRTMQRHFLELCRSEFSITESQLKTLDDKELARLGKIIAEKVTSLAHFQAIAGHLMLWSPIVAGLFLAFSVLPEFIMLGVFSFFSVPIFFSTSARNYRNAYLKIADQYGVENVPFDFLRDKREKN